MKYTKSIIASVLLVGAVVTTSVFAGNTMGITSKLNSKMQNNPFTNTTVMKALQDKGITVPTVEEAQAFELKMRTMHTAEKNLSETDKTSLKTLRESFKKQERDFLRSKGVDLPTEEEFAKMELIRTTLQGLKGTLNNGSGSLFLGRDGEHGMMGENGMMREKLKNNLQDKKLKLQDRRMKLKELRDAKRGEMRKPQPEASGVNDMNQPGNTPVQDSQENTSPSDMNN